MKDVWRVWLFIWQTKKHSSRMHTARFLTHCMLGCTPSMPPSPPPARGQTDTCKSITFPQLLLRAVKTIGFKLNRAGWTLHCKHRWRFLKLFSCGQTETTENITFPQHRWQAVKFVQWRLLRHHHGIWILFNRLWRDRLISPLWSRIKLSILCHENRTVRERKYLESRS